MTFKELVSSSTGLYPDQIPETLQATILDWFQYRTIAGDENTFPVYFRRVLNRDYQRYEQLLALTPGVKNYDWLVLREINASSSNSSSSKEDVTNSSNLVHGLVVDQNNNNKHTGTVDHKISADEASNYTNAVGSDVNSGSLSRVHKQDEGSNFDSTDGSVSGSSSSDGTSTNNDVVTVTGSNKTTRKQGYVDNIRNISKQNPQSISYDDTAITAGNNNSGGMPGLDWHYASAQGQQYTERSYVGTDPDLVEDESSTSTTNNDSTHNEGSNSQTSKNKVAYNRDESTVDTDTRKVDKTLKTGVNKNEDVLDTYNEENTSNSKVTNSGTDVNSGSSNKSASTDGSSTTSDRGRIGYDYISRIMRDAVNFIEETSAWEWLQSRLEVCFVGVYDL